MDSDGEHGHRTRVSHGDAAAVGQGAGGGRINSTFTPSSSAELYDPASGTWAATSGMGAARIAHTATLLPSRQMLVAGGLDRTFTPLSSAELYDPASGTWAATSSMGTAREYHTATLLPSSKDWWWGDPMVVF